MKESKVSLTGTFVSITIVGSFLAAFESLST